MPPATPADPRPSFFSPGSSFKRLIAGSVPQPDPDQDGVVWQEPESYSAAICRKDHPRDATALTSIRDVLRHRAGSDGTATPSGSKVTPGGPSGTPHHLTPPSARAKPAVEVSMQAADGLFSGMPESEAVKILHDLEVNPSLANSWTSSSSSSGSDGHTSHSGFVETRIRRGQTASIISTNSDGTVTADDAISRSGTPPPLPPKETLISMVTDPPPNSPEAKQSSLTSALTNTLTSAVRYVLKTGDVQRPVQALTHHGLLSTESPPIDERPHIKYDWTIGKRLRFSCTVYYAKQFDALRRRCTIQDDFLRSLARSENWTADGGKSKSNFWKTSDDQFIIKTLVDAWNVADL